MKRIFKLFSLTIVFAFLVTQMGMSATPAHATSSGLTFTVISPSVPNGWTRASCLACGVPVPAMFTQLEVALIVQDLCL